LSVYRQGTRTQFFDVFVRDYSKKSRTGPGRVDNFWVRATAPPLVPQVIETVKLAIRQLFGGNAM